MVQKHSFFDWIHNPGNGENKVKMSFAMNRGVHYSAFNVAELGLMLPHQHRPIFKQLDGYQFTLGTSDWKDWQRYDSEAQARAAMLIQLIQGGAVSVDTVNLKLTEEK